MGTSESTTLISQVGTVMIPVSDQDRALDFYIGTLGFETRGDSEYGDGQRWVEVAPPGAATTVALVPPREGEPTGIETRVALTTQDVDADHDRLAERGVDADAVMRMGDPVPPMFFFRDQDGNNLLIVERSS
jgi:catechol 2,3-dioxygenase-like lactoylglutathione lyase family enzyme